MPLPTNPSSLPRYAASEALHREALRLIPGGHHLSGRLLIDPGHGPGYFHRAKGCRIWDVDGNEYIDFLMAYGAIVLGYANEEVDRAAFTQISRGSLLSLNHPIHLDFVETVLRRFAGAEMAVFMKTGSEATTAALRIARRATGRRKVIRCGYHGWHDWCIPLDPSVSAGLPEQILELEGDRVASLRSLLDAHPGQIAAVIVAPEMILPHEARVFDELIAMTRRDGAVFVLDEIKTAFRTAPGSIQQRLALRPDLTTVSKALGNGWPVAAVLGRREVMEHAEGMHLSATYHGDTASMAAAMATLAILDRDSVAAHVWTMGQRLIDGLNERARSHGVMATAYGEPLPPMPFLRFVYPGAGQNEEARALFYIEVLAHGLLLHPRHLWFVSQSHREEDIDRALEVCDDAFRHLAGHLGWPRPVNA